MRINLSLKAFALAASLAVGLPANADEIGDAGVLTLARAIDMALLNNPGIQEIAARVDAANAVPSQAGSLPDPMITFAALNFPVNSFDLEQEPMTQLRVGLSQAFPFPGKRKLMKEAAEYDAAALANSYDTAELSLVRDIRNDWWTAFYLDRALEIVDKNLDLLRGFADIAGEKYAVGEGLQSDVVLAQLEITKLLDLEIRLKSSRDKTAARLRALLALPPAAPVRLPDMVPLSFAPLAPDSELLADAEQGNPFLAMQKSRISAADSRKELAERDFYPNFKVTAEYGFRSGYDPVMNRDRADFLTVGIGVSIPLYSGTKQSKALEQRRAEVQETTLGLARARLDIQQQLSQAASSYRQAVDQASLLETGILPKARQSVEAMRAAYIVDEVDFLNLVTAEITLYNYETRYWQVLAEANQALAEIAAITGKETNDE